MADQEGPREPGAPGAVAAAAKGEALAKPGKGADDKPKKKGGKLPVILALVLLLGGGGFFVMKMKAKGPTKAPEIKLGEIVPLKEYLINLHSASSYGRIEISLHLKEGYKKEDLDKLRAAVDDAINLTVGSHSTADVEGMEGKIALKKELAEAINKVLTSGGDEGKESKDKAEPPKPGTHPDWDSETGPVLKIYFTGFATQ